MTSSQLENMRNDLAFRMIEANEWQLSILEQELNWVEELLKEMNNGKEATKSNS